MEKSLDQIGKLILGLFGLALAALFLSTPIQADIGGFTVTMPVVGWLATGIAVAAVPVILLKAN